MSAMNKITQVIMVSTYALLFCSKISFSNNNLAPNQFFGDSQTLVSPNNRFELGFFSPSASKTRYVGIWYKNISPFTVVWVANRNTPVTNSSGILKIDDNGILVLNQGDTVIWSTDRPKQGNPVLENPIAMLLDSGNFVVTAESDGVQENFQWQSFEHPTDTLLPGMKLGWDLDLGFNNTLVSWKSDADPSPGDYTFAMEPYGSTDGYLLHKQDRIYRTGIWNGIRFSGVPEMNTQGGLKSTFFLNGSQNYYLYTTNASIIARAVVDSFGKFRRFVWLEERGWISYTDSPKDQCDTYKECGSYGICNANDSPICSCLRGFEPRNQREWNYRDGSSGCAIKTTYTCGKDDDFLKLERMKLPDASKTYFNKSMQLEECREMCEKNCSCTAYANPDIRDGFSACIFWIDDLVDLRQYATGGQDLYIRVVASELGTNHTRIAIFISATVSSIILVLGFSVCLLWRRTQQRKAQENRYSSRWTKHIAVKRLSRTSDQGVDEFKNEVMVIAKLQHRNLVRLSGCCIEQEEKILIYEYMSNKSLDSILFDKMNSSILDWGKRFNIIVGIARGLLYLHQDSRLRIVHRDLKASNVLLDDEMNPKISDFGMARVVQGNQTAANTRKVVGTYGYMAPEYAMDGLFSVKSDVFSYGVLVLEILSGRRNRGFYAEIEEDNLLGHAWSLWEEGKGIELIDEKLRNTQSTDGMMKCFQISLLCVQEHAEERPTIASVALMLSSQTAPLAKPNKPGFSLGRTPACQTSSSCSVNKITITEVIAR